MKTYRSALTRRNWLRIAAPAGAALLALSQPANVAAWQETLGDPVGPDIARAITVDPAGAIVAAGLTVDEDSDRSILVAKLDPLNGSIIWEGEFDGLTSPNDDEAFAVATDGLGDVFVAGRTFSGQGADLTVLKLSRHNGGELWRRVVNGSADNDDFARQIAVAPGGDAFVVGKITDIITSGNLSVLKLSGISGEVLWDWIDTEGGEGFDLALTASGQAIASGSTSIGFIVLSLSMVDLSETWVAELPGNADRAAAIALDPHSDVLAAGSRGDNPGNFALAKLSKTTGAPAWARQIPSGGVASDVEVDADGNVVAVGWADNTRAVGVYKLSGETGGTLWSRRFDGEVANKLIVAPNGDPIIGGRITDDTGSTVTVLRLASESGATLWATRLSTGDGTSTANDIALLQGGDVAVAGESDERDFFVALLAGDTGVSTGDRDGDGIRDEHDLCPDAADPLQSDADANGIGDECECGDQTMDGVVNVTDLLAINDVIFGVVAASPLCDTNYDGQCNVADILGANAKIFGADAYCDRYPPSGP